MQDSLMSIFGGQVSSRPISFHGRSLQKLFIAAFQNPKHGRMNVPQQRALPRRTPPASTPSLPKSAHGKADSIPIPNQSHPRISIHTDRQDQFFPQKRVLAHILISSYENV